YATRMLLKNRGFTTVVVLTLALGIGATTAIFSVINIVIFNPLPGPEPDRLIQIGERTHNNKDVPGFGGLNAESVEMLRTKKEFFSEVVWWEGLYLERKGADFIENLPGVAVSSNFFRAWNIRPILGHTFANGESARMIDQRTLNRDTAAVLSYSFWQTRYGGDPYVLGKTIELGERHLTITGVMPPHFQFPEGASPKFWVPVESPNPREESANIRMFARLKPGITAAKTQAMLDLIARQLLRANPSRYEDTWHRRGGGFGILMRPLRHEFTQTHYGADDLQRTLWALLAAISFVLLIVCVNVANLMLARTENRQQELAIRAAIGAGRVRLMRQLLTESVLLAALGALGGLFVAIFGMKVLISLIPETIPRLKPIHLDSSLLMGSLLVSGLTALVFGLVPALHASRSSVSDSLKQAGTGATMSFGWRRYRGALVITEVALSLILLTGAGLMIKSVDRLLHANMGFDLENVLIVHPGLLRGEKYYFSDRAAAVYQALYDELHDRFAALPGVKAAGIYKIDFFELGYTLEGQEKSIGLLPAGTGVGDSDLFRAVGIPLLAGRYFEKADIGNRVGTVIVNQTMARFCWPGENALNKKFCDKSGRLYEVIGVVRDARIGFRQLSIDEIEPTFYRPYHADAHGGGYGPYFLLRTEGDPEKLIPPIREIIKSVESSMTTPWFEVARKTLYDSTEAQRTYMSYLIVFSVVGLILAALGIYGVLAYSVARRTREIGIRIAIGAGRSQVINMIMRAGIRLAAIGIGLGALAAFYLMRLLQHQLYEVRPTDPAVFSGVVLLLLCVALAACYLPARRAAKVDPMEALRYE
ncbi:MAG: hypothetical protein JWM99_2635, partial [Verrucomicrobiales bacterium]|nr:hypothetical protein [Verrucomicrobiales bacterium]